MSKQTVPNVMNHPEKVRPETRERVQCAVTGLGFQPNRVARALRSSSADMIACRIEPVRRRSRVQQGAVHDAVPNEVKRYLSGQHFRVGPCNTRPPGPPDPPVSMTVSHGLVHERSTIAVSSV
ncbi:LacI family DNA-binding transcriptional regulator [Lentzea sp. DG1S-22]|uniref:LacI family DNA-binding transcriptional regulator n=1 Tax=Lentzea sp. DG1S-22 TaxID=3108822 RepID=UPI003FA5EC15